MKIDFDETQQAFHITSDKELSECYFSSNVLPRDELKKKLEFIFSAFEKHPAAMSLFKKAAAHRKLKIDFCTIKHFAEWDKKNLTIYLGSHLELDYLLLRRFIFELHNSLLEFPKFSDFSADQDKEYALAIEQQELCSANGTAKIMSEGVLEFDWPKCADDLPIQKVRTLEEFLESVKTPALIYDGFSHFGKYQHEFLQHQISSLSERMIDISLEISNKNKAFKIIESAIKRKTEFMFLIEKTKLYEKSSSAASRKLDSNQNEEILKLEEEANKVKEKIKELESSCGLLEKKRSELLTKQIHLEIAAARIVQIFSEEPQKSPFKKVS